MIYYTYIYYDSDWMPYYVGKGCGDRAFSKHDYGISVPPRGHILIQNRESESLALEAEKILIKLFGRQCNHTGFLLNESEGGRAPSFNVCQRGGRIGGKRTAESGKWAIGLSSVDRAVQKIAVTESAQKQVTSGELAKARSCINWDRQKETVGIAARKRWEAISPHERTTQLRAALHIRWHINKGITKQGCFLCDALGVTNVAA